MLAWFSFNFLFLSCLNYFWCLVVFFFWFVVVVWLIDLLCFCPQTKMEVGKKNWQNGYLDVLVFSSSSVYRLWDKCDWQILGQFAYSVFKHCVPVYDWPFFISPLSDVKSYVGSVSRVLAFGSLWALYLTLFIAWRGKPETTKWSIASIVTHSWYLLVYPFYPSERLSSCVHRRDFP